VNLRSIGFRLTAWYFVSLCIIFLLFGIGSKLAMQRSAFHVVDGELQAELDAVTHFLKTEARGLTAADLEDELSELSQGGVSVAVSDRTGRWVYRSSLFVSNHLAIPKNPDLEHHTVKGARDRIRIASTRVVSGSTFYTVTAAYSMHEFNQSIEHFESVLLISMPVALFLASLGGYLFSRRALDPVNRIILDAQSISLRNLSARLAVPRTGDELQRLSETINQMLERIERSVQQIHQFTADASHELRAPLTLMRTAAEFSLRRERSREDLAGALSKILRESERMSRLIDSLLLLARTDAGVDDVHLEPLNLAGPVQEAAEQARVLAQAREIDYEILLPAEPVPVSGDPDALRRVVFILIDNAIKYTPSGGAVSVKLSRRNGDAAVAVEDTGIGIAEKDIARVFDRFWRADKVRSRSEGGVGLGLSIAETITRLHRGAIELSSKPGRGSIFTVVLPGDERN
jgi:heavy metal sensor kinase